MTEELVTTPGQPVPRRRPPGAPRVDISRGIVERRETRPGMVLGMNGEMSTLSRYIALVVVAAAVSFSAVAVGRHHRPFSPPPAKSHLAPRKDRPIVIEQHAVLEPAPVRTAS